MEVPTNFLKKLKLGDETVSRDAALTPMKSQLLLRALPTDNLVKDNSAGDISYSYAKAAAEG